MIIRLEKASGIPVTRQILDQIRTQCATGALQPGDQLPSVRQLALDLAVNLNTVLRVYERLEAEGFMERRHGSGTFVTGKALRAPMRREHEQLHVEIDSLVRHAAALGFGAAELQELIENAYLGLPQELKGRSEPE